MVTNTTGTTNDIASNVKENGENATTQDNTSNEEYKGLKQSTEEKPTTEVEKVPTPLQNDVNSKMSNASDQQSYNQTPNSNGLSSTNSTFDNRTYGNGVASSVPPASVNGPYSSSDNTTYSSYTSYNHSLTYNTKSSVRPSMPGGGPPYSNSNRYQPNQHTSGTPTLNQLLATPPARHPSHSYSNYDGHGSSNLSQSSSSLNQQSGQNWHARPQVLLSFFAICLYVCQD